MYRAQIIATNQDIKALHDWLDVNTPKWSYVDDPTYRRNNYDSLYIICQSLNQDNERPFRPVIDLASKDDMVRLKLTWPQVVVLDHSDPL